MNTIATIILAAALAIAVIACRNLTKKLQKTKSELNKARRDTDTLIMLRNLTLNTPIVGDGSIVWIAKLFDSRQVVVATPADHIHIKSFKFDPCDDESRAYADICAEELKEMLES